MAYLKTFWNQTSNIVAWLGAAIAVYGIYLQTLGKEHEMSAVITSFEVANDEVVLGVLYRNTGDYQEAILNGSTTMVWQEVAKKGGGSGWGEDLSECFEPIIIKPKEAVHKFYEIDLKRYVIDEDYIVGNTINHRLDVSFYHLLPDNSIGNTRFEVGEVIHRVKEGNIKKLEVTDNKIEFNFSQKQNYGVGSTGSHPNPKYDVNHCAKKV